MDNDGYKQEVRWAWGAAAVGLVPATFWVGTNRSDFVTTWGPQALILIVMLLFGARPAALAGAALALAGYLAFFQWWVLAYYPTDGLVWLLYLFSLPGGLLAGLAASAWLDDMDRRPALNAGFAAAALVITGIAVTHISVTLVLLS